jgi:hypothetical protein
MSNCGSGLQWISNWHIKSAYIKNSFSSFFCKKKKENFILGENTLFLCHKEYAPSVAKSAQFLQDIALDVVIHLG